MHTYIMPKPLIVHVYLVSNKCRPQIDATAERNNVAAHLKFIHGHVVCMFLMTAHAQFSDHTFVL